MPLYIIFWLPFMMSKCGFSVTISGCQCASTEKSVRCYSITHVAAAQLAQVIVNGCMTCLQLQGHILYRSDLRAMSCRSVTVGTFQHRRDYSRGKDIEDFGIC